MTMLRHAMSYDRIGHGYAALRRPDPRIAAAIHAALGSAATVVNIGARAYEPDDRWVLAIEPSAVMVAQRPPGSAPALLASAEALPLADKTVEAAMATLTLTTGATGAPVSRKCGAPPARAS
jgi:hypothetical protein